MRVQKILSSITSGISRFFAGVWEFMNPPLWAMLVAVLIASVPQLQHLFFDRGTFLRNSVTRAIEQSGGVAVPLILVVLGGNLAKNTVPREDAGAATDPQEEKRLLYASLICRMLIPTIIMAPILAIIAKYIAVSIVQDKIFIIVCFLLTGAPSALQLRLVISDLLFATF
jgi:choline kinase